MTTTYAGALPDGSRISSLYPELYQVQFRARIGIHNLDVDKVIAAQDEYHARERAQSGRGMTIYGGITVTHVGTLEAAEEDA